MSPAALSLGDPEELEGGDLLLLMPPRVNLHFQDRHLVKIEAEILDFGVRPSGTEVPLLTNDLAPFKPGT